VNTDRLVWRKVMVKGCATSETHGVGRAGDPIWYVLKLRFPFHV
jgi:hypothetical protein